MIIYLGFIGVVAKLNYLGSIPNLVPSIVCDNQLGPKSVLRHLEPPSSKTISETEKKNAVCNIQFYSNVPNKSVDRNFFEIHFGVSIIFEETIFWPLLGLWAI